MTQAEINLVAQMVDSCWFVMGLGLTPLEAAEILDQDTIYNHHVYCLLNRTPK